VQSGDPWLRRKQPLRDLQEPLSVGAPGAHTNRGSEYRTPNLGYETPGDHASPRISYGTVTAVHVVPEQRYRVVLAVPSVLNHTEDSARALSISKHTVIKWVKAWVVSSVKVGSRRLILFAELQRIATEGLEIP
jgi:hypothetical protein